MTRAARLGTYTFDDSCANAAPVQEDTQWGFVRPHMLSLLYSLNPIGPQRPAGPQLPQVKAQFAFGRFLEHLPFSFFLEHFFVVHRFLHVPVGPAPTTEGLPFAKPAAQLSPSTSFVASVPTMHFVVNKSLRQKSMSPFGCCA